MKPSICLLPLLLVWGCTSSTTVDRPVKRGWEIEEPETNLASKNQPEVIVHNSDDLQEVVYPSEKGCGDKIEVLRRAEFQNGTVVEYTWGSPPKRSRACYFPDGDGEAATQHPPIDHHDVYVQFGDTNVLHKFEVRPRNEERDPYRARGKNWVIAFGGGVDLVAYSNQRKFAVMLIPAEDACRFPENVERATYDDMFDNIRIVYGGYKTGTRDYYFWDYGVLEPIHTEDEGTRSLYVTGFHNYSGECVDPTTTLE